MNGTASPIPPHEQFGFDVIQRAMLGERLKSWEGDFARVFWQSLEVHNGGFEQWIGNTGVAGALETLEVLDRLGLSETHRVTKQAFDIVKLASYSGEQSFYDYVEANIDDWFERLRPLNEAFWDDADFVDQKLMQIYDANAEPVGDV